MSTVALVALARPTFDLTCAQANFDSARALLTELGATVVGPTDLVMTVEDVAAVTLPDADLHILFMASFSDASPAVELLGKVKGPVLGWSMREPGEVGERLKLNSMCGVNLAAHALMNVGQSIRHIHGNADEPQVRTAIKDALAGKLPEATTPKNVTGELGSEADAQKAFDWMKGKKIGAVGDAPIGFTPCVYDAQQIRSLFGLDIRQITIDDAFGKIAKVQIDGMDKFENLGIIVRKGEWAAKDVTADRFITKFKEDGTSEIWLRQGDPVIYYEKPTGAIQEPSGNKLAKLYDSADFTAKYTIYSNAYHLFPLPSMRNLAASRSVATICGMCLKRSYKSPKCTAEHAGQISHPVE